MKLQVRINRKQTGALAALGQRLQNLEPAYIRASVVPLTAAQGRIRAGGPGWPPAVIPNPQGSLLYRTGALFRSFSIGAEGNVDELIHNGIKVGSNLKTPDGNYSIAAIMQYGTGPIKPKNGKLLAFTVGGMKIFSKGTRGIPPRKILYWDAQTSKQVLGVFASYVAGGEILE